MHNLLIIGYPKSGNTWLNFLLAYYFNIPYIDAPQEDRYLSGQADPPGYKGRPGIQGKNDHDTDSGPLTTIIKSHHLPEETSEHYPHLAEEHDTDSANDRIIMVVRDPRDVAVSYFYYRYHREHFKRETWLYRFLPYRVRDWYLKQRHFDDFALNTSKEWNKFVLAGIESADVIVRYEDLLVDAVREIKNITEHLEVAFNPTAARQAVEYCSFSSMQRLEQSNSKVSDNQNERFFRKGTSGQWVNYFSAALRQEFDKCSAEARQVLGY
jgi:hypothetical protein